MLNQLPTPIITSLVEEALDAVIIIDADGVIRYANRALQQLTGYGAGELVGQPLSGLLPAALAGMHVHYVRSYLEGTGPSTVLGRVREFALRHRTGSTIPIELKALDLGVTDGVRYFGGFMEDLRPRRALEAQHKELLARLEQQALTDTLTRLPNRRAFNVEAEHALARARRQRRPITLGVADIDHFKRVNDQYGHPTGDLVLCALASILREAARGTDVVARVGGEEFGLIFPDADPGQAGLVAERIRSAVEQARIAVPDGGALHVTVSIGLSGMDPDGPIDAALARADAALYQAKNSGRNRVATAPVSPPP
jgi:diguanylate cyclase (GGDEF)-like protein/PAS domain S-box-containing protein